MSGGDIARVVVVYFMSPTCAPCRHYGPTFDKAAAERPDWKFVKVNVHEDTETPSDFRITGLPTTLVILDGQEAARKMGVMQKAQLLSWVDGIARDGGVPLSHLPEAEAFDYDEFKQTVLGLITVTGEVQVNGIPINLIDGERYSVLGTEYEDVDKALEAVLGHAHAA